MGSKGSVAMPEPVVTPAVAKDRSVVAEASVKATEEQRKKMKGISSTYNRFANNAQSGGETGTATKLG